MAVCCIPAVRRRACVAAVIPSVAADVSALLRIYLRREGERRRLYCSAGGILRKQVLKSKSRQTERNSPTVSAAVFRRIKAGG